MATPTNKSKSALDPLKESPVFRSLWTAALATNTGIFMQDVAAAWLMTSLSREPIMVALMQTAVTLPYFLLALPFGALADMLDRRKLLIGSQLWMLSAATTLGLLTLSGHTNAQMLLALTFLFWLGAASASPASSAVTIDVVPRKHLEAAIGLGSAGYNLARGFGAALGGILLSKAGAGWVFIVNACCVLFMVRALWCWRSKRQPTRSREHIIGAIKAGVRYARHSHAMRSTLVRTVMFATAASVLWSLVPLHARLHMHVTAIQYGLLVSCFGAGTLAGAFLLPQLRLKLSLDGLSTFGTALFAISLAGVAISSYYGLACLSMFGCGVAWTVKNSSLNVAVQLAAPNWVRARAYAVYLLVFQGCTAIGAVWWGTLATWRGITEAMLWSALALTVGMLAVLWFKLSHAERLDVDESTHWQDPQLTHAVPGADDGPVMVTVVYIIDPARAEEFTEALHALETQRRRDGAFQWYAFRDLADQRQFCETFLVETWAEHMRQHERVLVSDRPAEQRVDAFHVGDRPPVVKHFIAARVVPSLLHKH